MTKSAKKIEEIQDELKVLKNEIKETLVDLREHLLTYAENPFLPPVPKGPGKQPTLIAALPSLPPLPEPPPGEPSSPSSIESAPPVAETPAPSPEAAAPSTPSPADPPGGPVTNGPRNEPAIASPLDEPAAAGPAAEAPTESMKPPDDHQPPGPMPAEADSPSGSRLGALRRRHHDADLLTLATLSSWLEDNLHALGTQRMRAVVEIYASMNGMSDELKSILLQLIALEERPGPASAVPMREYLRIVAELDNLLWRNQVDRTGAALMAVLTANPRPFVGKRNGNGNGIRQAA